MSAVKPRHFKALRFLDVSVALLCAGEDDLQTRLSNVWERKLRFVTYRMLFEPLGRESASSFMQSISSCAPGAKAPSAEQATEIAMQVFETFKILNRWILINLD